MPWTRAPCAATGTTRPACASAPGRIAELGGRVSRRRHDEAAARHRSRLARTCRSWRALDVAARRRPRRRALLGRETEPDRAQRRGGRAALAPGSTTAWWRSAAAPRSTPARPSRSWRARRARSGTSRTSATGGRARTRTASRPSSPCRPRRAPAPRWAAPPSSPTSATHVKKIIFHPQDAADVAICDPELTVGLPRRITAGTGMDAFSHCLEAYCAPGLPPARRRHRDGGHAARPGEPRARLQDGTDLEARAHMMSAAAMGATAFQKGLGAIHALSHPVGGALRTHHGLTNAVVMPYVLVFNRPAIEDRIARLAAYLGLRADVRRVPRLGAGAARRDRHPAHAGGAEGGRPAIRSDCRMAPQDPTAGGNPVPLDEAACRRLYERALAGEV